MSQTLQAKLLGQLERTPDRRALGFFDFHGSCRWLTYQELFYRAAQYASWLAERGLQKGEVCINALPSEEPSALLLLGTLFRGAVPLLIAPPTMQGEAGDRLRLIRRIARRTRARLVVVDQSLQAAGDDRPGYPRIELLSGVESVDTFPWDRAGITLPGEGELAALQLTSGTTGFPRVCMWRQRKVVAALDGMIRAMALADDDLCVNWTPLYHDMGLVNNLFLCLTHGVPLMLLSPQDFVRKPALWLHALSQTGATQTWSPNFGFAITAQRVRDEEIRGVRLDTVRAFWNAAERIHFETIRAFHQRLGAYGVRLEALKTNFGCAENVGGATFSDPHGMFRVERVDADLLQRRRIARVIESSADDGRVARVVGAGRPCPGITVQILSRTGAPLPEGRVGEVALHTPSRMEGYLGDARETRRALCGSLVRTGDLGYVRDGELFWVGRVKERITVRGRKFDPSDFEPVLLNIPGLRHGCFVAFGMDDPGSGTQRVVIAAEVREPAQADLDQIAGEIRERVFATLGISLDEVALLPPGTLKKTSSGKRRHRAYRRLYVEGKLKALQPLTRSA